MITIFRRDLMARIRDRSALVMGILAPLILIIIMGLLSPGPDAQKNEPLGLVLPDTPTLFSTAFEQTIVPALENQEIAEFTRFDSADAARAAVDDDDVDAAIQIGAPDAAENQAVTVLRSDGNPIASAVAQSIADQSVAQINAVTWIARAAAALSPGSAPPAQAQIVNDLATAAPVVTVADDANAGGLSPETTVAAGMATFFLFFTVQFGLIGLLEEKRKGTLRRLLAAPITPRQILGAKMLVSYALGVISMVVLLVAAHFLIGAEFGSPIGVGLLILAGVAAATATVSLVVGLAKAPDQAAMAQSMVALILGMLGGSFFSLARSGDFGAFITQLAPHHWFREGLVEISTGESWTAVLGPVGVLLLFTVIVGTPGVLLARRTVKP